MKLLRFADRCITVMALILFGALTMCSLLVTVYFPKDLAEVPRIERGSILFIIFFCVLGIGAFYAVLFWIKSEKAGKNIRLIILLAGTLLVSIAGSVLWVLTSHCLPVADQASICQAAEGFQNGDFSALTQDSYERYLYMFPHQLGQTALLEIVYALFGNGNYRAFQLLNCLQLAVCIYAGYKITIQFGGRKESGAAYLVLALFCLPLYFYTAYVYGEIVSLAFSLLAVYRFLRYEKEERITDAVLCWIELSIAILIRNNCEIILIALILLSIVKIIAEPKWKKILLPAGLAVCMLLSRRALHQVYEQRSGLQLNEGVPKILYAAMGMQEGERAPGWYNGYVIHIYWGETDFDEEKSTAMAKQDIKNSLRNFLDNPSYAVKFFWQKDAAQWLDPTCECFVMTSVGEEERGPVVADVYQGKLNRILTGFMDGYQSLLLLGVLCGLLAHRKEKAGENFSSLLPVIIFFGGLLFHFIWEAKGRYALPYYVMLLPAAAIGMSALEERLAGAVRQKRISKMQS